MEEVWKVIKGHEKYRISNKGRVFSTKTHSYLKPAIDYKGYLRVGFYEKGHTYRYRIHRLVAVAFIPNPDNLPQVNHKDENKANNNVENLEWCDNKYNYHYGTRIDRTIKSNTNMDSTSVPVICVETGIEYPSIREAARQTGAKNIFYVCSGKRNMSGGYHWKYATDLRRIDNHTVAEIDEKTRKVDVGDKVRVPNETRAYNVKARDDKYIICTRSLFGKVQYFIIDLANKKRYVGDKKSWSKFLTQEQCEERLNDLYRENVVLIYDKCIPLDIDVS